MPPKTQTQLLKHVSGAATRYWNSTLLQPAPEFFHVYGWTYLIFFYVLSVCLPVRTHEMTRNVFAADKNVAQAGLRVGQDDGELSIIPCFYIPVLLPCAVIHAWVDGPDAGPIPPREAGIPTAAWDEGILVTCVHPSCCFPTAALHRNRLPWGFIADKLNTVRHAMLTLFSSHCVITQLVSTVCKT